MKPPLANEDGWAVTYARIEAQMALIATLPPGSPQHELATKVLLLLQDSLYLLTEIDALTAKARRLKSDPSK